MFLWCTLVLSLIFIVCHQFNRIYLYPSNENYIYHPSSVCYIFLFFHIGLLLSFDVVVSSEVGIVNHEGIISDNSTEIDLNLVKDSARVSSSVQQEQVPAVREGNEVNNCSKDDESNEVNIEEPYVGQEFNSEDAAHTFYNEYAIRLGFIVRMDSLRRSRDGTVIKRTFVCNKEGYRRTNRCDENGKRPRMPFRMGCKAKLSLRRLSTGIWVVTKFIKEHAHPLPGRPGQNELNNDQTLNESARVKELTKQLLRERKRSASFRKIIDLLFSHIKEHTEELSRKIQHIADKVNEIDSMGKNHQENLR